MKTKETNKKWASQKAQRKKSLEERFWEKVDKRGEDECWEWQGAKMPKGYGVLAISKGAKVYSHRLAYALCNGYIDHEMLVCHSCDNPPCCNPKHLWQGTSLDNITDMVQKGRYGSKGRNRKERRVRGNKNIKLTNVQVHEVRSLRESNPKYYTITRLGALYGVHSSTIYRIIQNEIRTSDTKEWVEYLV